MEEQRIEFLREELTSDDVRIRRKAVAELAELDNREARELLLATLEDDDEEVRNQAALLITDLPAKQQKRLIRLFSHRNWKVRETASRVICDAANPSISNLLDVLKQGTDPNVTFWVIKTLGELGDPRALPGLLLTLREGDREEKIAAISAIAGIEGRKSVKHLLEALKDENWHVRKNAADALISLGPAVIEDLAKCLESEHGDLFFWTTKVLGALKSAEAIPYLVSALKRFEENERKEMLVKVIGEIGDIAAIPPLLDLLADVSWTMRKYAAEALVEIGASGIPAVAERYSSPVADVRYWIVWVAGTVQADTSWPLLSQACNDPEWFVRSCAAGFLGDLGKCRAVTVLLPLLLDDNTEVRKAASASLGRLEEEEALPYLERYIAQVDDETVDAARELIRRIQENSGK